MNSRDKSYNSRSGRKRKKDGITRRPESGAIRGTGPDTRICGEGGGGRKSRNWKKVINPSSGAICFLPEEFEG